jgi:hypothetical protein
MKHTATASTEDQETPLRRSVNAAGIESGATTKSLLRAGEDAARYRSLLSSEEKDNPLEFARPTPRGNTGQASSNGTRHPETDEESQNNKNYAQSQHLRCMQGASVREETRIPPSSHKQTRQLISNASIAADLAYIEPVACGRAPLAGFTKSQLAPLLIPGGRIREGLDNPGNQLGNRMKLRSPSSRRFPPRQLSRPSQDGFASRLQHPEASTELTPARSDTYHPSTSSTSADGSPSSCPAA